jgi:chondroitin-sulfate-ABC endolyase/exolyase
LVFPGLAAAFLGLSVRADMDYACEDGTVPTGLHASTGSRLGISERQAITSDQAFRWAWQQTATLTVDIDPDTTSVGADSVGEFWLYCINPMPGPGMKLIAGHGNEPGCRGTVNTDFRGWRLIRFRFGDMAGELPSQVTWLRLRSPSAAGAVFLDKISIQSEGPSGPQFASRQVPWSFLPFRLRRMDATTVAEPTREPALLEGVRALKRRLVARHVPKGKLEAQLVTQLLERTAAYGIEVTDEGMIGAAIDVRTFDALLKDIALACQRPGSAEDKVRLQAAFLTLSRFMLDRGHAAGSHTNSRIWYGTEAHYLAFFLMQDALAADPDLLDAVSASLRWANVTGRVFFPGDRDEWCYPGHGYLNQAGQMDYLICDLWGHIYAMLTGRDEGLQAAMLQAWGRWTEHSLCTHHYDSRGQIKPDGSLYHHLMFYSGYGLPAIARLVEVVAALDGSPLEVPRPLYDKLKFAYMRARLWAFPQFGTIAFGRHPLGRTWPLPGIDLLSRAVPGTDGPDGELAAVHVRVAGLAAASAQKLYGRPIPPEPRPDGYWSFNHAAAGIMHRHDRAVHFKGFASTPDYAVRGTEIYANRDNAYGRYQNYGTIEIFSYDSSDRSGFQYDGWDWCRYPGTTTLLLPLDRMKGPRSPKVEAPFAGSCHLQNDQGIFAFALDQVGRESLTVRKSAYAMPNGVIVCLGSQIGSECAEYETVTTLFQNGLASPTDPILLAGETARSFPLERELTVAAPTVLNDAQGNAYVVRPNVVLHLARTRQQSRHDKQRTENKVTAGDFATAWLSHGKAPRDASYHYAIIPGGCPDLVAKAASPDPGYKILRRDATAHGVEDRLSGSTAFAAFEGGLLGHDLLYAVDKKCFLICRRKSVDDPRLELAVADPNLNHRGKGPTTVTVTLNGEWELAGSALPAQVSLSSPAPGRTALAVTCDTGIPVSLSLFLGTGRR